MHQHQHPSLAWTISAIRTHSLPAAHVSPCVTPPNWRDGYTSSQALPGIVDIPCLPHGGGASTPGPVPFTPPSPHPWTSMFILKQWVYSDGCDIHGQPCLGAAVIHVPTCTTIYIDACGTYKTHTIMRAELMDIYTALDKFASHERVGIFTDSLSSL